MKIATWNINGIKARHEGLIEWLREANPDIVCLQEIKSTDETFPRDEIEALGYNLETHGQKGFNGVALLSKVPFDEVNRGLPGDDEDEQARFIEGVFSVGDSVLRVAGLYLPNGNPPDEERKFGYKLDWMDRLAAWTAERLALEEPLVLAGDFNVIPQNDDCHDPKAWTGDALFREETRSRFEALRALGLTDALRTCTDDTAYTFWDYQRGAWPKNHGIRIDHLLLSPEAMPKLGSVSVERHLRDREKPSDHVPVVMEWGVAA
ncbi:exodeoxyribonuclease III [Rhizobiaceae bacterium]|nr:exodeoxyribonuclease III [Rhizobiaceae bacterium]